MKRHLQPGLVSVTFRQLGPEEIIDLAQESGLRGIEWGGDVHVPHGDVDRAQAVGRWTRRAGLEVAAYGSYYRVGRSESEGLSFQAVLETAAGLEAPRIRVWAGDRNADVATPEYWRRIVDESRRIAELAARRTLQVVYEFHDGTLANTPESCRSLLEEVNHPSLRTYWQPLHGAGPERNGAGLELLAPWIAGVHVFHWWPTHQTRHPLADGAADWEAYFARLHAHRVGGFALLEFVKEDSVGQFREDARTLHKLLGTVGRAHPFPADPPPPTNLSGPPRTTTSLPAI